MGLVNLLLERLGDKAEEKVLVKIFPDTVKLLEDPCIWIGDTASTMHMTPHAAAMVPINGDKLKGDSIMVRNGKWEATRMHGSFNGKIIDKKGIDVGMATLTDIVYSPSMKFNFVAYRGL